LDLTKFGKQRPGTETRARGESALGLDLTKGILLCFFIYSNGNLTILEFSSK
jgi:hypothetical protein